MTEGGIGGLGYLPDLPPRPLLEECGADMKCLPQSPPAPWQTLLAIGGIVNSALYLGAVVAIGVWEHNLLASRTGLAAIGVTYLAYMVNLAWPSPGWPSATLSCISVGLGVLAGVALL